jgi:3-hydroxyacyl-[acyl-carrier-protein] dehydratase
MTIENARFRRPVEPGDQLRLVCTKVKQRAAVWKFSGEARVGDTVVAEATYSAMIMDQ